MTVNSTSTTSTRPVGPRSTAAAPATSYARSILLGMAGQEKIQPSHLQRLAIIYVRQSTPQQVLKNRESTDLQYQLARRAVQLGWSEDRVLVIDDDQAHTASTAEGRFGFQRLLAEVSLNHVGIVLGIEMSRLARSCKDWHGLLELCALFGTLLYDHDGVYDPAHYNDRLLLGLKGTLSEAELHGIKNRMEKGRKNKAQRGALFQLAPRGFVKVPSGELVLDPDEQARGVMRLLFEKFDQVNTAGELLRWLWTHQIELPVRPHQGPQQGQLRWSRPCWTTVLEILHHPIYAGAYVYGRRPIDPKRKVAGRRNSGQKLVPMDQWEVLLCDHLPAYLSWEQYLKNQGKLRENSTRNGSGAPREGASLLAGRIICGRCGYRMSVHYVDGHPYYDCHALSVQGLGPRCQSVCGTVMDEVVGENVLKALEPAAIELHVRAAEDLQHERLRLHEHWQQRLKRAAYESHRARRQYDSVEPENRLVVAELERRWDAALSEERKLQEEHDRFQHTQPPRLTAEERERIVALSSDIPSLYRAETTTAADRQTIIRHLIERVLVNVQGETELVDLTLIWHGGYESQHEVVRSVQCYEQLRDYERLKERVLQLRELGSTARETAEILNREGYRTPRRGESYNAQKVRKFLSRYGLSGPRPGGKTSAKELGADEWFLTDLARELSMPARTLNHWRMNGWIHARQLALPCGWWILWADTDELARLRQLRSCHNRGRDNSYPPELTARKPHRHTQTDR